MRTTPYFPGKKCHGKTQGTALILTLAALVLISILVLAFLASSSLSRLISYSSAGQARADQLAQTSIGIILGDLREEIVAGSLQNGNPVGAVYNTGGISVYVPTTNSTVVPCRMAPAVDLANANLVKISWATNAFWSGANYLANNQVAGIHAPVRSLAGNSTTNASLNQTTVANATWNQHYLLGPSMPNNWQPPDWVILTRAGAVDTNAASGIPTLAQLSNPALTNSYRAVGRYAYAIYDEGGLIDINVAGNQLAASQNTQRGRLDQIDLGQLYDSSSASPLIPNPSALVAWRSPTSSTNSSSTPGSGGLFDPLQNFLTTATNGAGGSDQRFVTRQDLINYAATNPAVISMEALQYLTTFSRDENAPSWAPRVNGAAGGFYNYQANSESSTYTTSTATSVVNRDLANVRFANGGTIAATANIPAYTVTAGQPLLIERFPLSRLTWIGRNGPANGATAADIKRAFGLVYVSRGIWNYTSPDNTDNTTTAVRIKSLNEVAALTTPRQPDFFELLQAGILKGSLGFRQSYDSGPNVNIPATPVESNRDMAETRDMERSTARQIMQIGANLIDQVQSDNWPTTILFNWFNDPAMNVSCPGAITQVPTSPPYIGPPFFSSASATNLSYLQNLYPGVVGVTDIPYVYKIHQVFYAHPDLGGALGSGSNGGSPPKYEGFFYFVEMWNPHQPTGTYTSGPTKFRVRVEAGTPIYEYWHNNQVGGTGAYEILCDYPFNYELNPTTVNVQTSGPQEIDFFTSSVVDSYFRSPNLLTTKNTFGNVPVYKATALPPEGAPQNTTVPGLVYLIPGPYNTVPTAPDAYIANQPDFGPSFFSTATLPTFRVDYQDESGNWSTYPYQLLPQCSIYYYFTSAFDNLWYGYFCDGMYHPDPRTTRLGLSRVLSNGYFNELFPSPFPNNSDWGPPISRYYQQDNNMNSDNPGDPGRLFNVAYGGILHPDFAFPYNYTLYNGSLVDEIGLLAQNVGGNQTHYTDIDGFLRSGDSINGTCPSDMSLPTPNPDPRPIILHRPFRTVGEMGYAYRDLPFKSLDMFSPNSADAALLDIFTVNDSVVHAGTFSLNTRQVPVLQAILQGSMQTESTTNTLTTTQANSMAQTMTNLTGGGIDGLGPIRNVSELATRFLPAITSTTVAPWIKTQREAAVRTLGQIGSTRVWNLLIDLVVQSGRYPTTASNLNNFVVEGQRHYWLHVAIDRTTGAILDQSLEPVSE